MSTCTPIITSAEFFAIIEEQPYIQTQALLVKIYEVEVHLEKANAIFGNANKKAASAAYELLEWFELVDDQIEEILEEIEEKNNLYISCQLTAWDQEYDDLSELINSRPNSEDIFDGIADDSDDAVNLACHLADYWVDPIEKTLRDILFILSGDGEPLHIVNSHIAVFKNQTAK